MPREVHAASLRKHYRRLVQIGRAATCAAVFCMMSVTLLRAQERVRSVAEAPLIEAYRRSPEAFFYLGPFQEFLQALAVVEYTDNVDLSETNKISDLSYSERLTLDTTWTISHLNQLEFAFGGELTEHFYGNGRNQVTFAVDPDSKIEFKFEFADFKVRLFDNFSYTQNPTTDPTATNTANLNSLTNTIGMAVDTDLSIAIFTLAGDFTYNNETGTDVNNQTTAATTGSRETFRVAPSLGFQWSPDISYGVNSSATRSTGEHSANVNSLSFGPFIHGKLNRDVEFNFEVGGTFIDTKPHIPPSYYYSAVLRYHVNKHWQFLLSGSHELIFTTGTGLTEQNEFNFGTQIDLTRALAFSAAPFVNFGDIKTTDSSLVINQGENEGSFTQFGIDVGLTWRPRKRWSTSVSYRFIRRESGATFSTGNNSSQSYIQNNIAFSIGYAF
jgi:hypothetical protein